jgi:hypothetical protein
VGGSVEVGGFQPVEVVELVRVEEDRAEYGLLGL